MKSFNNVLKHLKDEGVSITNFAICGSDARRGLLTIAERNEGEELLRVPLRFCLTSRPDDAPQKLREVLDLCPDVQWPPLQLALRVWFEKQDPSAEVFDAWVPQLLAGVKRERFAMNWPAEKIGRCGQLSSVDYQAEQMRSDLESFRTEFLETITKYAAAFHGVIPTEEDVEKLFLLSQCRAHALEREEEAFLAIIPVVDLVQHGAVGGSFAQIEGENVVIRSVAQLFAGSEVTYALHETSNDVLAVQCGITMAENKHQSVFLSLSWGGVSEEQLVQLQKLNLSGFLVPKNGRQTVSVTLRYSDPFPVVAMVLLRVLSTRDMSQNFLRGLSAETKEMDSKWMPAMCRVLLEYLKLYPEREVHDDADVIYESTRQVLQMAVQTLQKSAAVLGIELP